MLNTIPSWMNVVFIIVTLVTIGIFYRAANRSRTVFVLLMAWITLQAIVTWTGFYLKEDTLPPRVALLAGPFILFIIVLFVTTKGRSFLDSLDLKIMTGLHSVRIVVELVLYWLFLYKGVPEIMTFAGINFDILAGLTAPLMLVVGFRNGVPKKGLLLAWNIICLGLLFNIVSLAVLSAPIPIQQLAFDQPNIAILYFPYSWLPCCVVPLVLLSHLAAIRQLVRQ